MTFSETADRIQCLMNFISAREDTMGLKISDQKTKVTVLSRALNIQCNILVNDQNTEQVQKVEYLESWIVEI